MIYSEILAEKPTKVPVGTVEQVYPKLKPVFNFLILLSFHFYLACPPFFWRDRGNIGCPPLQLSTGRLTFLVS